MNLEQIRDALQAAGGDIRQADLGSSIVGTVLDTFSIPSVVGPVAIEGDEVVVNGTIEEQPVTARFSLRDGDVIVRVGFKAPGGGCREWLQKFVPGQSFPIPDAFAGSWVDFVGRSSGQVMISVWSTATIEGVALAAWVTVQLDAGGPELRMSGSATCDVQGQRTKFTIGAEAHPNGLIISGNMEGTLAFGDFQLSDVGLVIGVNAEAIPSVGLSATLTLQDEQASVAVFFDSTNPASSMVAGAISSMSLPDAITVLSGVDIPEEIREPLSQISVEGFESFSLHQKAVLSLRARDFAGIAQAFQQAGHTLPSDEGDVLLVAAPDGTVWHLTDRTRMTHYEVRFNELGTWASLKAQISLVPRDTQIGTQVYEEGIRLSGAFRIFKLRVKNRLIISRGQGALVVAAMDPIVILHRHFASITAHDDEDRGPTLNISTLHDPAATDPDLASPHCMISGRVRLLGLTAAAKVKIAASGFEYFIEAQGFISYRIHCQISQTEGFDAHGTLTLGGQQFDLGPLGILHIPSVTLTLTASFHDAHAKAHVRVEFALGEHRMGGGFDIDINAAPLRDALGFIKDKVREVAPSLDPAEWARMVKTGVIQGVAAVGAVLTAVYAFGSEQVAAVMQQAGFDVQEVADTLRDTFNLTERAAEEVLRGVGYGAEEAAKVLGLAVFSAAQGVAEGIVETAQGVEQVGEQVLTATGEGVINVANKIGKVFGF